jgi:hypothetical protein
MRTLFIWENCDVFDGRRAYWVEVPLDVFCSEIENSIDEIISTGITWMIIWRRLTEPPGISLTW